MKRNIERRKFLSPDFRVHGKKMDGSPKQKSDKIQPREIFVYNMSADKPKKNEYKHFFN